MKRKITFLSALIALVAVFALALGGCDSGGKPTGLALLQQQYNDISSAGKIEQTITIKKGELTQFESVKTFTKTASGYTVTGTEKKLNGTDAEELFTVTDIDKQVSKATGISPTLKLNDQYFKVGYRLVDTGLTAQIKPECIQQAFGITEDLKAPTDDLTLELSVSAGHVVSARITYLSDGSNVAITLAMSNY